MKWNAERKCYDFSEKELTTSSKRNVFKLLQNPEYCKYIDAFGIRKIEYGYSVKSFYSHDKKGWAKYYLQKIVFACDELNIPYSNATITRTGTNRDKFSWWIQIFTTKEDEQRYRNIWSRRLNVMEDEYEF